MNHWIEVIRRCLENEDPEGQADKMLEQARRSFAAAKRLKAAGVPDDDCFVKEGAVITAIVFHMLSLAVRELIGRTNVSDAQINEVIEKWPDGTLATIERLYTLEPKEIADEA